MAEKDKNKELIERMAETLRDHQLPYKTGSWERFVRQSGNKPKRVIWPYWAAAAILLVASGLFIYQYGPTQDGVEMAKVQPSVPEGIVESLPTDKLKIPPSTSQDEGIQYPKQVDGKNRLATTDSQKHLAETNAVYPESENTEIESDLRHGLVTAKDEELSEQKTLIAAVVDEKKSPMTEGKQIEVAKQEEVIGVESVEDKAPIRSLVLVENSPDERSNEIGKEMDGSSGLKDDATGRTWGLGLVVAPTLTSERVNLGGGVEVAYRLSDRFSLSSGIGISEMLVGQQVGGGLLNRSNDQAFSPAPNSPGFQGEHLSPGYVANVSLTDMTSNFLMMDVPLNLTYHVSKQFYTSVGMSFMTLFNEQRTYQYTANEYMMTAYGIVSQTVNYQRADMINDPAGSSANIGNAYGGFLNFSFGREFPLSRKINLSVEPFFKIPVGSLSRSDINLNNGGIRIVTGF